MENFDEVKKTLNYLNQNIEPLNAWTPIEGYCALVSFHFAKTIKDTESGTNNKLKKILSNILFTENTYNEDFIWNMGVPVKVFLNEKSGEIKLFSGRQFQF